MFFCNISVDILKDDYIYRFLLGFYNENLCNEVNDLITNGKFNSNNFAKDLVRSETTKIEPEKYTLFENKDDAIAFVENFFRDLDNDIDDNKDYLQNKYQMYWYFFESDCQYYSEDY